MLGATLTRWAGLVALVMGLATPAGAGLNLLGIEPSAPAKVAARPAAGLGVGLGVTDATAVRPAAPIAAAERARRLAQVRAFIARNRITPRTAWSTEVLGGPGLEPDWDYDTVVVHHLGTFQSADPQSILRLHVDGHHWADIGYHFMILADGRVLEARNLTLKGSHCQANTHKIGVLVAGHFQPHFLLPGEAPTPQQLRSLIVLCARLKGLFPSVRSLVGHRDVLGNVHPGDDRCPGERLYELLPAVAARAGLHGPSR